MSNEFPCTSCGLCCKNLKSMYEDTGNSMIAFLVSKFPHKILDDGSCEMLKDNQCSVYNDRPIICNVRLGAKVMGIDQADWYHIVAQGCNKMIAEAGLDPKYLVPLEK